MHCRISLLAQIIAKIIVLTTSLALSGCATSSGASGQGMTFTDTSGVALSADAPLYQSITVDSVTGGGVTNRLGASNIAPGEFKTALENSLVHRGRYTADRNAPYHLNAHLISLESAINGLEIWATSTVRYDLRGDDGQIIDQTTIEARYIDRMETEWLGTNRRRIANEGAIRNSIQQYLNHMDWAALERRQSPTSTKRQIFSKG